MLGKYYITNRARNIIISVISAVIITLCGLNFILPASWVGKPFPGFLVRRNNMVLDLHPEWEGIRKGIRDGDIIVAVNNLPLANAGDLRRIVLAKQPGDLLTYRIERGKPGMDGIKWMELDITVPVSIFSAQDYLICSLPYVIAGLFFAIIGVIVFYLKPNSAACRVALLTFESVAIVFILFLENYTTNKFYMVGACFWSMAEPFLFILALYFPVELKIRKYLIVPMLLTILAIIFAYHYFYYFSTVRNFANFDWLVRFYQGIIFIFAGFTMIRSYVVSKDTLVRQKVKIIIYGIIVFTVCIIPLSILRISGVNVPSLIILPLLFIMPLSFGYAVAANNAFDADTIIYRSLSYIIVSGIVLTLFFGLVTTISISLQYVTGQSSQIAAIISTLLLVAVLRPLRNKVDNIVDRRFFREKYEYRATIRDASEALATFIELGELLNHILHTVINAIKIMRGVVLIRDEGVEGFAAVVSKGYENGNDIPLDGIPYGHPLMKYIEASRRGLQINDIEQFHARRTDRRSMLELMHRMKLVLVVPVIYQDKLTGVLGLGEKLSGAWYSTEDIELLRTLMVQTALFIENARKVEELKKMVELETSYRELKKLDELKDHFLSMVSHDLRTPMTSIRGYASLIHSKAGNLSEERQKHFSSIIISESERLTRLINDLLDLQRFEAGKMLLEFAEMNLVDVVKAAIDSFRGAAMTKRIEIIEEMPYSEVMVNADSDRLAQVVSNLLSNAIKFTPEDQKIIVTIEVSREEGKEWAKVSIRDNGPGIPKDQQEKLFSKFQQVEGQEMSKERGSGLGLALVREIINYHNGTTGLESEPAKGSVFYFKITTKNVEETNNAQKNPDRRR